MERNEGFSARTVRDSSLRYSPFRMTGLGNGLNLVSSREANEPLGWRSEGSKANKPNILKMFLMNEIDQEWAKQTRREYLLILQPLGVA